MIQKAGLTIKFVLDRILSFFLLALSLPLQLLIASIIKIESSGPIFFRQERAGLRGKPFTILKFRSMIVGANSSGPVISLNDSRVTRVGRFLRLSSLDELPQFWNVLKGEMSFVGPRPEVLSEVETYSEEEKRILTVSPGITDYASLTYHNEGEILMGEKDPHEAYRRLIKPGKLKLALKYVDESGLRVDLKILYMTAMALMKSRTNNKPS